MYVFARKKMGNSTDMEMFHALSHDWFKHTRGTGPHYLSTHSLLLGAKWGFNFSPWNVTNGDLEGGLEIRLEMLTD